MTPTTHPKEVTMSRIFTTTDNALAIGDRLVIAWTRRGEAPAGTIHITETVIGLGALADGRPYVALTGGDYLSTGLPFRVLPLLTTKGKSTRQIAENLGPDRDTARIVARLLTGAILPTEKVTVSTGR